MSPSLRLLLIASAIAMLAFIIRKIGKSQLQTMDAAFWIFFSFSFVVFAIIPELASRIASLLGFQAASNFVFVYVIAVLVYRDFSTTVKYARLRDRFDSLLQELSLRENDFRSSK